MSVYFEGFILSGDECLVHNLILLKNDLQTCVAA